MFCVLLPLSRMNITRQQFIAEMGRGKSASAFRMRPCIYRPCSAARRTRKVNSPNAERIARETVTLPLMADMTEDDVDRVCDNLIAMMEILTVPLPQAT